jgi:hypothetical protein
VGDEGRAGDDGMPLFFKELKIGRPYFISNHGMLLNLD